VPGIMGDGAILSPTTDRTGAITTINIINPGEDYVAAPNVYLRVADVAISNVTPSTFPERGETLYQGVSVNNSTYQAKVDSITVLSTAFPANSQADIYQLRTYNYTGSYNSLVPIKIDREISNVFTTFSYDAQNFYTDASTGQPTSIIRYGDGNARANAQFLDGLIVGTGKWLNNDGQLSSLGLVLESLDYNNFTYILSVERALKTYKDLVLNLLHPAGMNLRGRYLLNSANGFNMQTSNTFQVGFDMDTFAGPSALGRIEIDTGSDQISTNIIRFVNTISANIGNTVFANNVIEFTANNNLRAYSVITEVDWANNQVYTQDNVFVLFANVAVGSANASSNVINITSVTGQYDGKFVNRTPANSIIFVNDSVSLNGGPYFTVQQVFSNGNILIANDSFGPIENALITVNKSANTDFVKVYGVIGPYVFPELLTEDGKILLTESGFKILAG